MAFARGIGWRNNADRLAACDSGRTNHPR
jgi:hypothetical protein